MLSIGQNLFWMLIEYGLQLGIIKILWPGAVLPSDFVIKKSKLRGVESFGMLCAEDEIGIGTSHDGIIELPADCKVGTLAKEYYHIDKDYVIEVDITPNRIDAASHYGVARDLAAYFALHNNKYKLTLPDVSSFKVDNNNCPVKVTIENTKACPRYSGVVVSGVTIKESPEWMQKLLRTIGLRPINNVVDVTNFMLHAMGQPLHAFDLDKMEGKHIIVKNLPEGTPFTTLDGVERKLSADDLMICDEKGGACLAGVFGGLNSGVTDQTKNVFIESAYFNPVSVRKTARRHGLNTDASFRYERGCDPNNTLYVLQRCALLIQEVAGGQIAMNVADKVNNAPYTLSEKPFQGCEVELKEEYVNSLIGKAIGHEMIETILGALEMQFTAIAGGWKVIVPTYRTDVQRPCDVVEDILRIYGYNNVEFPDKLNSNLSYNPKPNPVALQTRISEQLTAQGFNEIMNNSLTKTSYYKGGWAENCVKILNPLSQDLGVMRQTLLFGGLESLQSNINRKNADLKFYEFGNCYHFCKADAAQSGKEGFEPIQQYSGEMHLGLWLTGNKTKQSWVRKDEKSSFYQLHAYVNAVLRRMGVNVDKCVLEPAIQPDQEKCCGIGECFSDGLVIKAQNGVVLGYMAIVDKALCKQFDIDTPVYYADLYWQALLKQNKQYKPVITDLPKFPEVKRDFALLVDKAVQFADLAHAAFETERKLLRNVSLFDVYEGKNLEDGKKSYALSFILQDPENTLKDKQIEIIMQRLQHTFEEKFGAKLR